MSGSLFLLPFRPAIGLASLVLPGAKCAFYAAGTTTLQNVYADSGLVTPLTNPVVANAAGAWPAIYYDQTLTYKVRLSDANDVQLALADPYTPDWADSITPALLALINQAAPMANAHFYSSTAAGLAATSSGGYFVVATGGAVTVYLNSSGTAVAVYTYPNIVAVTSFTGCDTTGATASDDAFNAAVASLPASGGTIVIPDATAYKLDTAIVTGTKKVRWQAGSTTITCPPGAFGFKLQSNGSSFRGAGRRATILKLRAPASALVMPSVTTARTAGALTTATPSGGSGLVTTPVAIVANSPTADALASDAAVIATVSGGTVSALAIVAAGADYSANPAVTFLGGGHGAVMIEEVQGCSVGDFSIDFSSIANSIGVYHYGGWWADISNIDNIYTIATGVSSESASSIGLVVDSHTNGAPGTTGSYGGAYVNRYSNLHFTRRALIGHDSSTGTTMHFDTCSFGNSYIHGCVGITETNPVNQSATGDFYNIVNVDGLTLNGGDMEGAATWIHAYGSCSNIKLNNVQAYSASGSRRRGPFGPGWTIDVAKINSTDLPLHTGSLNIGQEYQNSGYVAKHGFGLTYDGGIWVVAKSNLTPISATQGNLDDVASAGMCVLTGLSGQFIIKTASAGANPRTLTTISLITVDGVYVGANRVIGPRQAAIADTSSATLPQLEATVNALKSMLRTHGLIAP